MLTGTNPLSLINQLAALGECGVAADTGSIPPLGEIDPEKCYTGWYILLTTKQCIEEVRDVFIFVEDDSELSITRMKGLCMMDGESGHRLIGDLLLERGDVSPEALDAALKEKKRLGEVLLEMGALTRDGLKTALAEQKALDARWKERSGDSVKVASEKLDVLAGLVGEIVTSQARLRRAAASLGDPELLNVSEEMDKLTEILRDNALSMRMVAFGSTFTRFKRLVRDLSRDLGKDIEFSTGGGETELDKTVIERLGDPLMHLIRNCVDHGIEPSGDRIQGGKHSRGIVSLDAAHVGGKVVIHIADDGRGLDPEQIRRVAVERGLLGQDERPPDRDLFALTLAPGFSTAASVSRVSGRGVGLDVVKKAVDSLRGTIEISSVKGAGTRITLTLPLTLAIIEGLLVGVDEANYVVPLSANCEVMERVNDNATLGGLGDFMEVRGELVPCVRLREFFGLGGTHPGREHVVVVRDDTGTAGLVVDEVIGEHQAVIKPLSRVCSSGEGVSGATILGDGGIALILDMAEIIRSTRTETRRLDHAA
jgi:two-component system chemotaxis sensor kinase CheA